MNHQNLDHTQLLLSRIISVAAFAKNSAHTNRPEDLASSVTILKIPLLILGFAFCLAGSNHADEERVFLCRKTEDTIRLDGKASEPSWKTAEEASPFVVAGTKTGEIASTLTSARLLWDDKFLYFFAEMKDEDLTAKIKIQDGEIWKDDVFELFFKPSEKETGYYEFEINALGTKLDMYIPERHSDLYKQHKSDRKFAFASKVTTEGTLNQPADKDKGWTVEGRIPWTDLKPTGGKPDLGATWRFNLCRFDYSGTPGSKPELSVIAPKAPRDFHSHESYAPLKFVDLWDPRTALPENLRKVKGFAGSKIVGTPDPPLPYVIEQAETEHRISRLITFQFEPGSNRMLYVDQPPGVKNSRLVRYDPKTKKEVVLLNPVHVIYDFAFHPDWKNNHQLIISTWGPGDATRYERSVWVDRFNYDPASDDMIYFEESESIFKWPTRGHTGGALAFDDDGLLYITTGDGTSDSDNNLAGQNLSVPHAKVMRIDIDKPDGEKRYSIPPDNPFLDRENTVPETFAYGMRNPWRSHWDSRLKKLWVGNNGQDRWEQVFLIEKGGNYGWSVYEGGHPFYLDRERGPDPILKPAADHDHGESRSLTGGVVYTGDKYPDLKDCFLYGDHTTGKIWAILHDGNKVVKNWEIADTQLKITEFGVDPVSGDILIASHENVPAGGLYKLIPNPRRDTTSNFPRKLSETGFFTSVKGHRVSEELLPYDVIIPQWNDGANMERYLAMPESEPHIALGARRGWNLPDGTVALQSIALGEGKNRRFVETRILTKADKEWSAYTYAWNAAQDEATLVGSKGADIDLGDRKWTIPSRTDCMVCHSRATNFVIGLKTSQINKVHDYGNGYVANQLQVIDDLGFFLRKGAKKRTSLLRKAPDELERFTNPFDSSQDINDRARSYIHANCAHCHVESGGGNAKMSLTSFATDEKFNVVNAEPNHGDQGLGKDARIVVPGNPGQSILFGRCSKVGPGKMPPIGSSIPDSRATSLLIEWITSLK